MKGLIEMPNLFEEQIEEILEQSNSNLTNSNDTSGNLNRGSRAKSRKPFPIPQIKTSPSRIMVSGLVCILAWLVLRGVESNVVTAVGYLGLVLLIFSYGMFVHRSGSRNELRWRGRPVDYSTHKSWWRRFRD